jgi:hypothetical protein
MSTSVVPARNLRSPVRVALCLLSLLWVAGPAAARPAGDEAGPDGGQNQASPAAADPTDTRADVEITVFTGISIDSFAAKALTDYINKDDSNAVREQLIAGFDFSYRVTRPGRRRPAIWVYGEVAHGARSGEANCGTAAERETELCREAALEPAANPNAPLAIFRKATTLETFFGMRAELLQLRSDSDDAAAKLYVKGQLGLLTVAGRGGDVVDVHHVGLGVILTKGHFKSSYLEAGYGKNTLFESKPERWKFDGFLSMGPDDARVRPFAQITVDVDFGSGADSIQSYFGFDIDVRNIWK